jgi:putative transposase
MPKAFHAKAKSELPQIWLTETREMANKAVDRFLEKYGPKYEAACSCLSRDQDILMAFYDLPVEQRGRLRPTNPIESNSSTIHLRHRRTKGSGSWQAASLPLFQRSVAREFGPDSR